MPAMITDTWKALICPRVRETLLHRSMWTEGSTRRMMIVCGPNLMVVVRITPACVRRDMAVDPRDRIGAIDLPTGLNVVGKTAVPPGPPKR